ncbi:MAG: anthranilate synthase component I [Candidatus Gastranaerophilales bacterium]|nr:anthranilate synthase component I [Candidatus Gastranaerophilales bacterium]
MFQPEIKELENLSNEYKYIPVSTEIFSDITTPIQVLRILKEQDEHCFLLESVEKLEKVGRYSFLGFEPSMEITCQNGVLRIKTNNETKTIETNSPQDYIKEILDRHKSPKFDYLPPFTGGLAGYFSYDFIKYYEPALKLDAKDEENFKDVDLMLFDKIIAFDNIRNKIILIVNISADDNLKENYEKAIKELERIKELIQNGKPYEIKKGKLKSEFKALFNKEEYCKMVEKAKEYIKEGDIFQVVLSNRFDADYEGDLLNTYRTLRTINPSPYMFYFGSNDIEIAGASPETLVKLENGKLYTFPLAGTRKRGTTKKEDDALEKDLLSDKKELAEHNMLVDLGRNDIGKISKFGSVEVERYMTIEKFSHVMHIGSTVTGDIREDKGQLDTIGSILPAGTLSGAPKLRACEIINELENNKRGIYGGAIGYLDFTGNLDTCIAIRIAFKKNNKVFVRVGAGIVYDSIPENEYIECINKSKAVINALKISQEVL